MAITSLGRLTVDLMMKTGGLEKGTREGRKRFKELDEAVKQTENTIAVSMAAAGAAAAGFAAAVAKITTDQMELIKTQNTLAKSLNSTITGLKAVNEVAEDNSIEGMEGALARLQRRLGAFENNGGGPAAGAIKALNLNTKELANSDADKKIEIISRALKEQGVSSAQAARYVQDLGFEQKGVVELFKDGGKAIAEQRASIEAMGRAVSQIDAAKITIAKREFDGMGDSVDALKTQLAIQLAPVFGAISKPFNDWASTGTQAADRVSGAFDATITSVGYVADAMAALKTTGELAGTAVAQAIFALKTGFLEAGQAVINGPVTAINSLIELSNRFLGTDFATFKNNVDWSAEIKASYDEMAQFGEQLEDIALSHERPSEAIREFVDTAKEEYQRLAEEQILLDQEVAQERENNRQAEYVKIASDAAYRLEMAKATGVAETEILALELLSRQTQLSDALAEQSITEQEFIQQSEIAWAQYNQNLRRLDDTYNQQKLRGTAQLFSNLSTLMNTQSRKLFEIGKVAAYANTVVTTSMAAMEAYAWGLKYGGPAGPALATAAAGAAIIAGGVQLAAIASTKFGGTGGAAQTPTAAVNAATEPVGQQQAPQQDIYIRGLDREGLYSGEQVLELVNEAINSGGRLVGVG